MVIKNNGPNKHYTGQIKQARKILFKAIEIERETRKNLSLTPLKKWG